MKKIIYSILLLLSALILQGQDQNIYSFIEEPICWDTAGVDSSLTRIWLVTDRNTSFRKLLYTINAHGQFVYPQDSISFGWCNCCDGGNAGGGNSVLARLDPQYIGINVESTPLVDSIGFDTYSMPIIFSTPWLTGYIPVYDTTGQVQYRLLADRLRQNIFNTSDTLTTDRFLWGQTFPGIYRNLTFTELNRFVVNTQNGITFQNSAGSQTYVSDNGFINLIANSGVRIGGNSNTYGLPRNDGFHGQYWTYDAVGDTMKWTAPLEDSTRLVDSTILVYYQNGIEIGRDTLMIRGDSLWLKNGTNIYYNGPVGIGTAAPSEGLEVSNQNFKISSTSGFKSVIFELNGIVIGGLTFKNGVPSLWGGSNPENHLSVLSNGFTTLNTVFPFNSRMSILDGARAQLLLARSTTLFHAFRSMPDSSLQVTNNLGGSTLIAVGQDAEIPDDTNFLITSIYQGGTLSAADTQSDGNRVIITIAANMNIKDMFFYVFTRNTNISGLNDGVRIVPASGTINGQAFLDIEVSNKDVKIQFSPLHSWRIKS